MADLSVEVRHLDIVVTSRTGHWVTYRRELNSLLLEAVCSMRSDPRLRNVAISRGSLEAAYAKASALAAAPLSRLTSP
jgi:hypothetical protein